mgnify:CR=1 FL=1
MTGNPVRPDIETLSGKKEAGLAFFGLSGEKRILLVIGGSLGALTINESMEAGLPLLAANDIQILWQTGRPFSARAADAIRRFPKSTFRTFGFIERMDLAYAVADAVVSRAGAASISELCIVKKPAILVPSPNVAEDHQTMNARALTDRDAAELIRDCDARTELVPEAVRLLSNTARREHLAERIGEMAFGNAAGVIARQIIVLAQEKIKP